MESSQPWQVRGHFIPSPVIFRLEHTEHEKTKLTAAFTRFDQDGNGILDEKEQKEMRQNLKGERVSPDGWWRGYKETAHSPLPAAHPEHKPTWMGGKELSRIVVLKLLCGRTPWRALKTSSCSGHTLQTRISGGVSGGQPSFVFSVVLPELDTG